MKTQEEYIQSKGEVCPFCGSPNINWIDYPTWTHNRVWVVGSKCKDKDCGKAWEDTLTFESYKEITDE